MLAQTTSRMQSSKHDDSAPVSWYFAMRARLRGHLSLFWLQTVCCVVLALAVRAFVLLRAQGMLDADEAVLGIQAEHILRGAHPVYFYGQAYMGSWDAYLVAPIIAIFGPSAAALHAVTLVESLLLVPLMGALAGRLFGPRATLPGMFLAAMSPLYVTMYELRMLGGYVETLVLGTSLMLIATYIAGRWQREQPTARLWLFAGLLAGLGLWIDLLLVCYVAACALWLAPMMVRRLRRGWATSRRDWAVATSRNGVLAMVALTVGASPALIYALRHQFRNVLLFSSSSHPLPEDAVPFRLGILDYLVRVALPRVIGAQYHIYYNGSALISPASLAHPGLLWRASTQQDLLVRVLETAAGATAVLALVYTLWLLIRDAKILGRWLWRSTGPGAQRWNDMFPLLLLVCLTVLFWRTTATADQPLYVPVDGAGRYALPATTALGLMCARGMADLGARLGQVRRAPSNAWINVYSVLFALIMLVYALPYAMFDMVTVMQSPYNWRSTFPVTDTEMMTYLRQHHIHHVWASHWYGNIIMYLTDGDVLCADYYDIVVKHGVNRFPHAFKLISQSDRPSFIVTSASPQAQPSLLHALDALHVTYTSAHFHSIWVITPTSRTVRPAEVLDALG